MAISELITQFLEYLEIEKGRSPYTIANYDRYLRTFLGWAKTDGQLQPKQITLDLVRKFRLYLSRRQNQQGDYLRSSTQNYYIIALRSFLRYLQKQDIDSLSPEKIELARQVRKEVSVLDVDQLELILKAARPKSPDDIIALRDYAILETLFSTGLRVSELVGLDRSRINLQTREFMVRGKGSKDRIVFLSETAAYHLGNYLKKREDDYLPVFIRHRGQAKSDDKRGLQLRLSSRSVQRLVNKYARLAGIVEQITPHTLRHTFATDLLQGGADLRSVQEMLGHSSVQTTQVYTHVTNKKLRDIHAAYHDRKRK